MNNKFFNNMFIFNVLAVLACGCGAQKEPAGSPNSQTAPKARRFTTPPVIDRADDVKIVELERRRGELSQALDEMSDREMVRRIIARHPDWTDEVAEQQISLLRLKWMKANRTDEEDSVADMKSFGSYVYHSELTDDDYRDVHRMHRNPPELPNTTLEEIMAIDKQIETIKHSPLKVGPAE